MNNNVVVTIVLCLVVFIVGFALGRVTAVNPAIDAVVTNATDTMGIPDGTNDTSNTSADADGGATVSSGSLTDGQRKLIEALGIDADSITITPEMVACAEAKLGVARIDEIKGGATPSFSEGVSLMACYNQ